MSNLFSNLEMGHMTSSWTLPGGLSAEDDDDQRRLNDFLNSHKDIKAAVVETIKASIAAPAPAPAVQAGEPGSGPDSPASVLTVGANSSWMTQTLRNPMRFSAGLEWFKERNASRQIEARTADDQVRAVNDLRKFLEEQTELGKDPWLHEIGSHHLLKYMQDVAKRPGRHRDDKGEPVPVGAKTKARRLVDLNAFFGLLTDEGNACCQNPVGGLNAFRRDIKSGHDASAAAYWPFSDEHLRRIFKPEAYLAFNRQPDYFWAPLFSAHTGVRLSEIVMRKSCEVRQDSDGVWYLAITDGKTDNSVRVVPITQPLLDLGFTDYAQHVQALGGEYLFPHCDFTTPTAQRLPAKNQSDRFGDYLDELGMKERRLVFHSFRHTVVCALLDNGTPIHISMQICGHEAQDEAIRRKLLTEEAARSVHLRTYTHADLPRLGKSNVLLEMKAALETSVRLPLDYERLRVAAEIVKEHVVRKGDRFKAGWPAQNGPYTQKMVDRVRRA